MLNHVVQHYLIHHYLFFFLCTSHLPEIFSFSHTLRKHKETLLQSRYIEISPLTWIEYPQRESITSVLSGSVRKLVMLLKSNNGYTGNLPCPPVFFSLLLNKEMKIILQIHCTNKFSYLLDEMELETLSFILLQLPG